MTESKGAKARHKTTNWSAYNAALKARGSLTIWLDKDMRWYAPASGKRGCQRISSDAAIQFCLSIKYLFNLALRQSLGLVESLLRLAGLDWSVPDFSTVCRRQKTLRVQLPYRASTAALDLLVDTTGIKFLGEGERKRKKHGAGGAPMLPELLAQVLVLMKCCPASVRTGPTTPRRAMWRPFNAGHRQ